MGKQGKIKNGNNKAKHTKLLNQKKQRVKNAKMMNKQRLKDIITKSNKLNQPCPCGLDSIYKNCCHIAHNNILEVTTAEQLMRSRYTAYVLADINYLMQSHHSSTRPINEKKEIEEWMTQITWRGLEILQTEKGTATNTEGMVNFNAYFIENNEKAVITERSVFVKENGHWVYLGIEK